MTLPGTLIIARHHESEWNKKGLWTGTRDVHLTEYGREKSKEMGKLLPPMRLDQAFASAQVRSHETLDAMLETLGQQDVPKEYSHALDERDYGDYTGKNKWDMKALVGEEMFDHMRRDWDYPIPNGETLKTVYERVVPFYTDHMLPLLTEGKNVLVVSHGNALRALMIYLESVPPEKAPDVKMLFGAVVVYKVDEEGRMVDKRSYAAHAEVNA